MTRVTYHIDYERYLGSGDRGFVAWLLREGEDVAQTEFLATMAEARNEIYRALYAIAKERGDVNPFVFEEQEPKLIR